MSTYRDGPAPVSDSEVVTREEMGRGPSADLLARAEASQCETYGQGDCACRRCRAIRDLAAEVRSLRAELLAVLRRVVADDDELFDDAVERLTEWDGPLR